MSPLPPIPSLSMRPQTPFHEPIDVNPPPNLRGGIYHPTKGDGVMRPKAGGLLQFTETEEFKFTIVSPPYVPSQDRARSQIEGPPAHKVRATAPSPDFSSLQHLPTFGTDQRASEANQKMTARVVAAAASAPQDRARAQEVAKVEAPLANRVRATAPSPNFGFLLNFPTFGTHQRAPEADQKTAALAVAAAASSHFAQSASVGPLPHPGQSVTPDIEVAISETYPRKRNKGRADDDAKRARHIGPSEQKIDSSPQRQIQDAATYNLARSFSPDVQPSDSVQRQIQDAISSGHRRNSPLTAQASRRSGSYAHNIRPLDPTIIDRANARGFWSISRFVVSISSPESSRGIDHRFTTPPPASRTASVAQPHLHQMSFPLMPPPQASVSASGAISPSLTQSLPLAEDMLTATPSLSYRAALWERAMGETTREEFAETLEGVRQSGFWNPISS